MLKTENYIPNIPDETLVLTFDDGPGPNTLEIATYLNGFNIKATFFVVGKHVREQPDIVSKVAKLGHTIGNHTNCHPVMHRDMWHKPRELVSEVIEAHRLIKDATGAAPFLFRAPYGDWFPVVADILNQDNVARSYFGPIGWDIDRGDYGIGEPSNHDPGMPTYTVESCKNRYLESAYLVRRGVILLHDWCADPGELGLKLQRNNRALELTKLLVPQLLAHFKFAPLDQVLTA